MRILLLAAAAIGFVALAACAPNPTNSSTPAAVATSLALPTAAPTQVIGSTSPAQAPTAEATSSQTAPTTEASPTTAETGTASASSTAMATEAETAPAETSGAPSSATSSATLASPGTSTLEATGAASSAATAAATPGATAPAPDVTITVQASEFKFDPNNITVKAGQRVRIVLANAGKIDHELEIDTDTFKPTNVVLDLSKAGNIPEDEKDEAIGDAAQNQVHAYTAAGGTASVDFTPTQTGTFSFACNITGHKEAGMVGTITITQ